MYLNIHLINVKLSTILRTIENQIQTNTFSCYKSGKVMSSPVTDYLKRGFVGMIDRYFSGNEYIKSN